MNKSRLKLATTPLARWLAWRMASWIDPETLVPGISQNRLHVLAGVSQAQLHEILKKGHAPKPETLDQLAKFFGISSVTLYRIAYLGEHEFDFLERLDRLESILAGLPSNISTELLSQLLSIAQRSKDASTTDCETGRQPADG